MARVVVIGGGAGGMLAAGRAAECGAKVVLLEKNSALGKKLRITGKGRCNVTNTADKNEFVEAFGANGKFLYGAFSRFSNQDLRDLLERLGVPTKVERGGRVFPTSDKAEDIILALHNWLKELKVDIRLGTTAKGFKIEDGKVVGVEVFGGTMRADAVILATGGITYPQTGSTGDGYQMAREIGHKIIPPIPSLAALETAEAWVPQLQGLSLRNVNVTLMEGGKKVAQQFGEMLFTHFGVSGPAILTLSKTYITLKDKESAQISINLKPAVSREQLEARLLNDFVDTKYFKNYLPELLPRMMIPVFMQLSGISSDTPLNSITQAQRKKTLNLLLDIRLTVTSARAADEAIVTSGGVLIGEIDSRTMESKLITGLYFCGEVIDIDAVTGGFNLQAAFSTGWVAGESAAGQE